MKSMGLTLAMVLLFMGMVLALTGCGPAATETPAQTVTLAMGFVPNIQFAPFYVAVEKGYFAQEGITVQFDYGWETDLLKLVGSGELKFAIASGDQVILARSQGLPVHYVLNWYRRFPVCVVSLAETGIEGLADLADRRVGTPVTFGASYIGWRALLEAAGVDGTDIELVSIGYTQVAALTEGQVDAAICYAMNEPVQMQVAGYDLNTIYVADYINLVSNGLITNDTTARDQPALVLGMVRAALRGLTYTLDHPDEAFEISRQHVPELGGENEVVNRAILEESIRFWRAPLSELGRSDGEEWQASQRIMVQMELTSAEGDVTAMFTNRFVEEVDLPSAEADQ